MESPLDRNPGIVACKTKNEAIVTSILQESIAWQLNSLMSKWNQKSEFMKNIYV